MDLQIVQILKDYGWQLGLIVSLAVIAIILVRIILDEDRSALFRARIYKSLLTISGKREHEKKYLANDLRGRINLARRNMHFGRQALPQAVKVEWVEGTRPCTYDLSDGEFVIRLDPAADQTRNILRMVEAVVCRTSLAGLRNLILKPLRLAIQLTLIRKVLRNIGNPQALDEFFADFYQTFVGNFLFWDTIFHEFQKEILFTKNCLI